MNVASVQIPAFKAVSNGKALSIILAVSAIVFAFLLWLVYLKKATGTSSVLVDHLDVVNAGLNSLSTLFLILGLYAVLNKRYSFHMKMMFSALLSSALFFICYVIYHSFHGDTKFPRTGSAGAVRPYYLALLASHIILSAVAVPMILASFYLSLSGRYALHKKVSRLTFPIWLYVSVTGVVVFVFLRMYAK
jgi:putative membrane protein